MMDEVTLTDEGKARNIEIKPQTMYTLDVKDINTPEELLACFKCMQTTFNIVEDSEVWHELHEAGMGHLLTLQVP
jgi:hypothetical protein